MRLIRIFIFTFIMSGACFGISEPLLCNQGRPFLNYEEKKLTGMWHLEYIGADLAKEFVLLSDPTRVRIGIVDAGLTQNPASCGTSIRTNISDLSSLSGNIHAQTVSDSFMGKFGASNPVFLTTDSIVFYDFRKSEGTFSELKKSATQGLRILNLSIDFADPNINPNFPTVQKYLSDFGVLDRNGVIIVTSAGNSAAVRSLISEFKMRFPGIVVGALGPDGLEAEFSQHGEEVKILAPGVNIIRQIDPSSLTANSGTSIASPLVAGSIANVLQISPQFTRNNVELLIQQTAINLKKSGLQSQKMINSYKMVRVAKKIQDQMNSKKFTSPLERERFIASKLVDPDTNSFSSEVDERIKLATALQGSNSCADLVKAITLFREAFMLSESNIAKMALINLYKKIGFEINSNFYKNL